MDNDKSLVETIFTALFVFCAVVALVLTIFIGFLCV